MRFIHLLLAFAVAVGVSAAHFKRDFSPVYGINLLTSQTQSLAALLGNIDLADLLVILSAKPTIAFFILRTARFRSFREARKYHNYCHDSCPS